jgi:hypothetical protein
VDVGGVAGGTDLDVPVDRCRRRGAVADAEQPAPDPQIAQRVVELTKVTPLTGSRRMLRSMVRVSNNQLCASPMPNATRGLSEIPMPALPCTSLAFRQLIHVG